MLEADIRVTTSFFGSSVVASAKTSNHREALVDMEFAPDSRSINFVA
jgi:hypothetical protein